MNLLKLIITDSAGDERNNDVFYHYKTLKWKISANQGKILSNYLCLISEGKVEELVHQIRDCYHNYYFNVRHHQ